MPDLVPALQYNYPVFSRPAVLPLLRFAESPPLGVPVDDFALRELDGTVTSLAQWWRRHDYTVIEFGSFT